MHRPDLVILDEPTLGLDPLMQREFRNLVKETKARGATVFLSSHVLSEVDAACDRIGLIRGGRLERVGSLNELRAMRIYRVEARFTGQLTTADLAHVPGVTEWRIEDHLLTCALQGSVAPLLEVLSAADVIELDSHEMSLEEVFFGELDQAAPPMPPVDSTSGRQPAHSAARR
jgi:ABC-2 type transport system ATP-binding protein